MGLFMFELRKDPQGVYTLYFDKPPANAFDDVALHFLQSDIEIIAKDPKCRALIFAARGRFFSAGADISYMGRVMHEGDGPDKLRHLAQTMQNIFRSIELLGIPTLACLSGIATGGGLELALACDFRVVEDGVKLGLPECKIGLLPGAGGTQRLTRLIGGQKAKRMIMTGEIISAKQAHDLGLVDEIVPPGQGESFCHDFCNSLVSVPKMTLSSIKKCLDLAPSRQGFECEIEETYALQKNPETQQLISNFLQRSKQRK